MSRLESVLDLPYRVLKRYHAGFALYARSQDSEALADLIAEGHLKLVKLNRTLPEDLVGEDFRLRCLAILRRHYQRLYHKSKGLSWRHKSKKMETRKGKQPQVLRLTEKGLIALSSPVIHVEPGLDMMSEEAQEFLDGLGTAQKKAVEGVMAGRSKNEVARELGMSPHQLQRILGDAVAEMQTGGVL